MENSFLYSLQCQLFNISCRSLKLWKFLNTAPKYWYNLLITSQWPQSTKIIMSTEEISILSEILISRQFSMLSLSIISFFTFSGKRTLKILISLMHLLTPSLSYKKLSLTLSHLRFINTKLKTKLKTALLAWILTFTFQLTIVMFYVIPPSLIQYFSFISSC